MIKWLKKLFNKKQKKSSKKGGTNLDVKEIVKLILEGKQPNEEQLQALKDFVGKDEQEQPSTEDNPGETNPDETKPDEETKPSETEEVSNEETPQEEATEKKDNPDGEETEDGKEGGEAEETGQPPAQVQTEPTNTPPAVQPNFDEQMRELRNLVASLRGEVENVRMLVIENTKKRQEVNEVQPSGPRQNVIKKVNFLISRKEKK